MLWVDDRETWLLMSRGRSVDTFLEVLTLWVEDRGTWLLMRRRRSVASGRQVFLGALIVAFLEVLTLFRSVDTFLEVLTLWVDDSGT